MYGSRSNALRPSTFPECQTIDGLRPLTPSLDQAAASRRLPATTSRSFARSVRLSTSRRRPRSTVVAGRHSCSHRDESRQSIRSSGRQKTRHRRSSTQVRRQLTSARRQATASRRTVRSGQSVRVTARQFDVARPTIGSSRRHLAAMHRISLRPAVTQGRCMEIHRRRGGTRCRRSFIRPRPAGSRRSRTGNTSKHTVSPFGFAVYSCSDTVAPSRFVVRQH